MLRYLIVLLEVLKLAKGWIVLTYVKSGKIGVGHPGGALNEVALEERGDDSSRDSCLVC